MAYYRTRGLRGSTLEEMVNMANEIYRKEGIALIQKIPTPIKPVEFDSERRTISLAYFEQRSTVDYIGVVQGIPVCFDAKECAEGTFPIQNIHEHQAVFMESFERQGGVSFLLIYFSSESRAYYMRFEELLKFWNRSREGGRKSFRMDELDPRFFLDMKANVYLPYLDLMNLDLSLRDQLDNT